MSPIPTLALIEIVILVAFSPFICSDNAGFVFTDNRNAIGIQVVAKLSGMDCVKNISIGKDTEKINGALGIWGSNLNKFGCRKSPSRLDCFGNACFWIDHSSLFKLVRYSVRYFENKSFWQGKWQNIKMRCDATISSWSFAKIFKGYCCANSRVFNFRALHERPNIGAELSFLRVSGYIKEHKFL